MARTSSGFRQTHSVFQALKQLTVMKLTIDIVTPHMTAGSIWRDMLIGFSPLV